MFEKLFPNVDMEQLWEATYETIYMTGISLLFAFIIGVILGMLLYLTSKGNIWQNRVVNGVISAIVNVFRSIPFIILIILLLGFTKFLMNTILGPNAALPALIIASAPFYARLVEIALREVDKGVIEAAKSMGAKTSTIIFKVLLPESMPALISGITVTAIALIGSTAMAGAIGSGGLGNLAYVNGFQMNNPDIILIATIFILAIVFIIQFIGDFITNKLDKR
ncbi:methionine ABC transporter permease [Bacillus sp. GM2]|jgi:D-methionine transport system permease protein|uniref:Binding-protein-dependent transport systems inner membrane component n=5 Tax=Bacillus subtilis group TaxID=653685 RepID=Q65F81_BACLD|nr:MULTISPECIES: methionine ABC transporter permease [Bacillus]ETB71476.1 methionine import system permease MetP [Bacillus sp. CPSM8]KJD55261.1 methionine ABC transporter permease [Bacillus amyloliquefaciens]KUL10019.1 methionine import system permease MetP [Bacillus licheniformis LMG 7559]KUL15545.1 methionine import system permease MetP [Bacillus licheniformis LMG 6934]MBC8621199.1 ABC transporter permease [Robertmurraya crescens]MBJ7888184.1 ABC transporter permease [Bacillaceae bacterium 